VIDDHTADPRVDLLLEQILNSGESPEEACHSCPELLPKVREGLQQLRQLDEQVSGLFPASDEGGCEPPKSVPAELPVVPGYEVLGILAMAGWESFIAPDTCGSTARWP